MKKTHFIIVYKAIIIFFLLHSSCNNFGQNTVKNKVLILGDSLSAGYGLVQGTGWVSLLQKDWLKNRPNSEILNASISGDTTAGGKQRLPELLNKYPGNILVIELGANDALRGFPLETTKQNLLAIVKLAQDKKMKVLIIGIRVPTNYGPEYTSAFYKMFADIAKATHSSLVPFLLEGMATERELFQEDGIHPNERAQVILLKNVQPRLEKLLQ
jgi:acyl-CoA thioesterase-1